MHGQGWRYSTAPQCTDRGGSISMSTYTFLDSLVVLSGTEQSLTFFERTPTPSWGIYTLRSERSGSSADRRHLLMQSRPSIVSTQASPSSTWRALVSGAVEASISLPEGGEGRQEGVVRLTEHSS